MATLVDRVRALLPTREGIEAHPWIAPYAERMARSGLWRFNRRSVPRGVAVGLFAGVLVPFAHTLIAIGLALPFRANVFLAAASTWISNPVTWVVLFPAEKAIGKWLLGLRGAHAVVDSGPTTAVQGWLSWLLNASGEVALGSVVVASAVATLGYFVALLAWRWRVGQRWRRRHDR